jgi:histidinol-phosphate aminotransferase
VAQSAAIAAWRDRTHLAAVINATRAARDAMAAEIRGFGFTIPKSAANFIYLSLPRGSHALYTHLLRAGIITRPVADIGLRVTVGQPEQNERFLTALEPRFAV